MNQKINYSEISYKKSGARLKELLRSYGITQKEFGEKFGYTQQHISQIINGKKRLTEDLAKKILEELGFASEIRLEWLLGNDDFRTYDEHMSFCIKKNKKIMELIENTDNAVQELIKCTALELGWAIEFDGDNVFIKDEQEILFSFSEEDYSKMKSEISKYVEFLFIRLVFGVETLKRINMQEGENNGSNHEAN